MRVLITGGKETNSARIAHALAVGGFEIAEQDTPYDIVLTIGDRPEVLLGGGVAVDLTRRSVRRDGQAVWLTPVEYALLSFLVRARRPVGRDELLRELWGLDFDPHTNSVAVHISRLRRKLGPDVIETVPTGYTVVAA